MRLVDYNLIQSLRRRLQWFSYISEMTYLADLMAGKVTDYWWLDFPNDIIYLKYDHIYNKFVLTRTLDGTDSSLLINQADIVNLLELGANYELENRQDSSIRGWF